MTSSLPEGHRIGAEGDGWRCLLHGLNPERILIAAEAVGLGQAALERAARALRSGWCLTGQSVRTRPLPIPSRNAGWLWKPPGSLTLRAASRYDAGLPCGADANAAKYLAEAALQSLRKGRTDPRRDGLREGI